MKTSEKTLFIDGNEALVKAALDAGCNFFAGYPITPATPILLRMMQDLPKNGGIAIQGEDELASIGMCLGAAMTGKKVLTATSGPGLSLYSENIGFAIMAEIPIVIVDVQRTGPSTGSATKDSAMDIQFIRWGTSGGHPIIALAPADVPETYELTIRAFHYAQKFRTPVFIMSSKELAMTRVTVRESELVNPDLPPDIDITPVPDNPYQKAIALIGGNELARITGSSHDEDGNLTKSAAKIEQLNHHLNNKIDIDVVGLTRYTGPDEPESVIISYGITTQTVREAIKTEPGTGHLEIKTLWPVPEAQIKAVISKARRVIVPELNLGLYAREIRPLLTDQQELVSLTQVDTDLMSPERIHQAITEGVPS